MSMPPRSRTGSGPLIAGLLIVLAIVIALVAFAATGITPQQLWDGFFPIGNQTPVTDRSLSTKCALRLRLLHRRGDLLARRGR